MSRPEAISTTDIGGTALGIVARAMREAVAARGRCLMSLAGGATPLPLYRRLTQEPDLPWPETHLFWGDERFVPPDHPDSNALSIRQVLGDRVPVPPAQVHPWPILDTPEASAAAYANELLSIAGDPPLFDLTLLGLGADCHTASLFPGTDALTARGLTVASRPPAVAQARLSLTATALSHSRIVMFLVAGASKSEALAKLLDPNVEPGSCPARSIGALERLLIVTDLKM